MYKLTVVAGPDRGKSYAVHEGETSMGRQSGNVIVLSSSKVSKKHCRLVLNSDQAVVEDQGSSNGTFVNGVLTRSRELRHGDRIGVGEFVLEFTQSKSSNVIPIRKGVGGSSELEGFSHVGRQQGSALGMSAAHTPPVNPVPQDIKGKAIYYFETVVMPFFYGLNLKNQWKHIFIGLSAIMILLNLFISVQPLLLNNHEMVVKEMGRRAQFMARQIVERNTAVIAARTETKAEIGAMDREEGVRVAVLLDLDSRIIAPSTKMNQYLATGAEASFARRMSRKFKDWEEILRLENSGKKNKDEAPKKSVRSELIEVVDSETVAAIEPVVIFHPQIGKNVVVGMALVALDTSTATLDLGEMGVLYSETFILTALIAGILLFVLYRVTLKPFQVLNDDIDKVLKGELSEITHDYKFEEVHQLFDVVSSALQRIPKTSNGMESGLGGSSNSNGEDFLATGKMLASFAKFGVIVLDGDRKIVTLNSMFEEISGIRSDSSIGQDIPSVARDQSFGPMVNELFDRAQSVPEGVSEDYDFSGISYKLHVASAMGGKGFLICVEKGET